MRGDKYDDWRFEVVPFLQGAAGVGGEEEDPNGRRKTESCDVWETWWHGGDLRDRKDDACPAGK